MTTEHPLVEIRTPDGATQRPEEHATVLDEHLRHFQHRSLQQALLEGTTAYWERRAEQFDTVGNTRCDQVALNCRRHAQLLTETGLDPEAEAAIDIVLNHLEAEALTWE